MFGITGFMKRRGAGRSGFAAFLFMGVPPKPPTDPADGLSCAQAWRVGVRKGLCVACPLLELKPHDAGQADGCGGGWYGEHKLLNLDYVY